MSDKITFNVSNSTISNKILPNSTTLNTSILNTKNTNWTWTTNTYFDKFTKNILQTPPPLEEEMIEKIISNTGDRGFFQDILDWLRKVAPKKVSFFIRDLYLSRSGDLYSYEKMCELVYKLGFRANDVIEKRMILSPSNEWVKSYFKDFPL